MTGTDDTAKGRAGEAGSREDRLAEALRANLRRRKTQARARGDTGTKDAAEPAPERDAATE